MILKFVSLTGNLIGYRCACPAFWPNNLSDEFDPIKKMGISLGILTEKSRIELVKYGTRSKLFIFSDTRNEWQAIAAIYWLDKLDKK